jgi:hypothetical protein
MATRTQEKNLRFKPFPPGAGTQASEKFTGCARTDGDDGLPAGKIDLATGAISAISMATDMGSIKKRRKAKINKHKRRKKLRLNRHKKRTWQQ